MTPAAAERLALARLKVLEETWPKHLWIFASGSGTLHVMRKGANGEQVRTADGLVDQSCIVATFEIEADGGDF